MSVEKHWKHTGMVPYDAYDAQKEAAAYFKQLAFYAGIAMTLMGVCNLMLLAYLLAK